MATTKEVYDHHTQAFFTGDVDSMLEDYTDQSVLVTDQGVVMGLTGLRRFFEQSFQEMASRDPADFKNLTNFIEGDVVFHSWSGGDAFPYGTETYIIRDGKIAVHSLGRYVPQ